MSRPAMLVKPPRPAEEVWNARAHGLVGDGETNDQPALAALVDRVGRLCAEDGRGRVIYCPPGAYLIRDESILWRSGVCLLGAGEGATRFILESRKPMALAMFTQQHHGASTDNHLADCTFEKFEIDGSRVQLAKYDTHAKGLDLQYLLRGTFRDLHIHDTAATGLGCDFLQDSVIEAVYAINCGRLNDGTQPGGAGIGIGIGGWGAIERTNVTDCICAGNATNGVFVELQQGMWPPPRGIKILGSHCVGNRYGISDWGADGLIVGQCVMCENLESGFDVSTRGTAGVAGRGGMLNGCVIDNNLRDGVSMDAPGPYTVSGNRISNNGRYGYHQFRRNAGEAAAHEIVIEANDLWLNGLDGIELDRELVDATIAGNRIRNNGRRCGDAFSGGGPAVTYGATYLHDAGVNWPLDAHKGKTLQVAGRAALVIGNGAQELGLAPWRPGATSAWQSAPPAAGTPYELPAAPPVRAGVTLTAPMRGLWIRNNRIWDHQALHTQTHAVSMPDGLACERCAIDRHED